MQKLVVTIVAIRLTKQHMNSLSAPRSAAKQARKFGGADSRAELFPALSLPIR